MSLNKKTKNTTISKASTEMTDVFIFNKQDLQ